MDTKAFTSFLHSNIPLTEFMDIQAETYTPEKMVLSVPFAQNKNDKNTGFAGKKGRGNHCPLLAYIFVNYRLISQ